MNIITDCYTDGSPTLETLQITCWHTPLSLTCWLTEKSVSSLSAAVASLYHAGGGCVAPGTTSEHYTKGGSPVQLSNITGGSPLQLSNTRAGSPIQVPNTTPRGGLLFNFRTLHYERVSCTTSEHHGRISYTTSEHYTTRGSPAYNPGLVLSLWDIKKISKWYFLDLKSKLRKIPKNDWARDDWE